MKAKLFVQLLQDVIAILVITSKSVMKRCIYIRFASACFEHEISNVKDEDVRTVLKRYKIQLCKGTEMTNQSLVVETKCWYI